MIHPFTTDFVYAVGLMSGTSADAIDAVLLHTNGVAPPRVLATYTLPYPDVIRQQVLDLYEPGDNELDRMGQLDHTLGQLFAQAALAVIQRGGQTPQQVRVIGSHGQTIRHRPPQRAHPTLPQDHPPENNPVAGATGFTLQIGSPFVIAAQTGITTVANFRPADMVRHGEGAPLVPLFHQALFANTQTPGTPRQRVAVVNLGGIANLTALPDAPDAPLLAGDTGPANTLLDLLAEQISQGAQTCDWNGAQAAQGRVDATALHWLLAHPYFSRPFPKSTGRELFGQTFLHHFLDRFPHLPTNNYFATLSELTAHTVAAACRQTLPPAPHQIILCGGGVKNKEIIGRIQQQLPESLIIDSTTLGVDADTLEAQAFAWFAVRTLRNLPSSLPGATGAHSAAVLGAIHPPG